MTPKYPIKAFDGTTTSDIQVLNVPAGAIDPNGEIDLGLGVKVYRALLTQSSSDAPVATVLENTLGGTVVWTRDNVGVYIATLTGAFSVNKTVLPSGGVGKADISDLSNQKQFYFDQLDANTIKLVTGTSGTLEDDALQANFPVTILVYP